MGGWSQSHGEDFSKYVNASCVIRDRYQLGNNFNSVGLMVKSTCQRSMFLKKNTLISFHDYSLSSQEKVVFPKMHHHHYHPHHDHHDHHDHIIVASMIISGDGRLTATEGSPPLPLLSVSLFGRVYSQDADQPLDFCPGGN